jgi:dipeptidyl aminopeptidase/acylaminoacyl peptidase
MVVSSYDATGDAVVVNRATPASIGDLFIKTAGGDWKQVTHFNEELFRDRYIGWPERVTFSHPAGTTLEGWVIKPMGFEEAQVPLVGDPRRAPHDVRKRVFFTSFRYFAARVRRVVHQPAGAWGMGRVRRP